MDGKRASRFSQGMVMLGNQQEDAASCWLPSPCQSAGGLSEIEECFMYTFLIMLVACGENSTISYLMGEQ